MITIKEGYEITEQEDGKWVLSTPIMSVYCDRYEDALKAYIERHNRDEACAVIYPFFEHYNDLPVSLRMHLKEEDNLIEATGHGFSDHFIARDYRGYVIHKCKHLYSQLTSCKERNRGKFDFEIDEMREYLMRLFDIVKQYEHELHEYIDTYIYPKEGESDEEQTV